MASGSGSYGDYGLDLFLDGLIDEFTKAQLYDSSTNQAMSDVLDISWNAIVPPQGYAELNVSGGAKVFTISQTGTVDKLYLFSGTSYRADIDLTPVVYSTATYYTLSELTIYFN